MADPTNCCTSDFNDDGLLDIQDIRVMYLWIFFVLDKDAPLGDQLALLEGAYASVYSIDPPVTLVDRPRIVCSDFDDSGVIDVVDCRVFYLWVFFVNKSLPLATQLTLIDGFYASVYTSDPVITSARIPEILDPLDCVGQKGWFITPWIEGTTEGFGWLE
jgi:hypothetical protein